MLHEPDAKVIGEQIDGCYQASLEDQQNIDRGVKWLANHFSVKTNPPVMQTDSPLWHYYYLYGLERAGRLTARRKFGPYDWYREGAKYLVQAIGPVVSRNSWKGAMTAENNEDVATSLALLFLSKGRWPVLMAKAEYRSPSPSRAGLPRKDIDWNRHRRDVNNLTIYVESKWQKELTWQTIDLDEASVDDLLQVPVLFFSGGGNPLPESVEKRQRLAANLRAYVDRGGFIFADGEGCSSDFDKGFRDLMALVFEKPEYRFKPLDASHPIWIAEQKIPPDQVRLLLGIDYGCRTSVVYAPSDPPGDPKPSLATLWELSRGGMRENYSAAVKEKIEGGLAIGINVLAYATNRDLKPKEYFSAKMIDLGPKDPIERGKFAVAKLEHPGGCDAAPRALANLMEQAGHDLKIRVETNPKLINMQDPALLRLRGRLHARPQRLPPDRRRTAGVADVCRAERAVVCRRDLRQRGLCRVVPPRDGPDLPQEPAGGDLAPRSAVDRQVRLQSRHRHAPRPLAGPAGRAAEIGPAPRSAGVEGHSLRRPLGGDFLGVRSELRLEKHDSMECRGYSREDAARIGLNILSYGIQQ